jgi:hypothetical protein
MSNRQTRRDEKAQTSDEAFQAGGAFALNVVGDSDSQPATITSRLGHVLIIVE